MGKPLQYSLEPGGPPLPVSVAVPCESLSGLEPAQGLPSVALLLAGEEDAGKRSKACELISHGTHVMLTRSPRWLNCLALRDW